MTDMRRALTSWWHGATRSTWAVWMLIIGPVGMLYWQRAWTSVFLRTYLENAGIVEVGQVWLAFVGLLYSRLNLREVWLDFKDCFSDRPHSHPMLDFLVMRRWRGEATKQQMTARANVMSESIKTFGQVVYVLFGIWTWFVPPPPPNLVREIQGLAQHFGPALVGLEAVVIFASLKALVHSIHERHARIAIDGLPFRRRAEDKPLQQVTP